MVYQDNKKLKSKELKSAAAFSVLTVFLLFACASVPKPEKFYAGRSGFALMAEGAELYITAQVQSVRPILDSLNLGGMSGEELKDFFDKTKVLTVAFFPATEAWRFFAAASGNFPSARGGIYFGASKNWEKRLSASGMPYWYSPQSRLSVSLYSGMAYLSDDDPFVPPPGAQVPAALPLLQKGAVLSGWMNNPARVFDNMAGSFTIPLVIPAKRMIFAVYPEPSGQYSAVLHLETPSPAQAAALARLFALVKLGLSAVDFKGDGGLEILVKAFFSQNPKTEGNALLLNTGVMEGKDLALLFNAISVH